MNSDQSEALSLASKLSEVMGEVVTKQCRRCGQVCGPDQLKRDRRNGDGYSSFCRRCHSAATQEWIAKNRDRVNATRRTRNKSPQVKERKRQRRLVALQIDPELEWKQSIWYRFRLTPEAYATMEAGQGYRCAICQTHKDTLGRRLSVDHDHACCPQTPTCGQCHRGLLCGFCNLSIQILEDPERLEKAL